MRLARHMARMGEIRGACRVVLGKHERRRPLGRTKARRLQDNIKADLQ